MKIAKEVVRTRLSFTGKNEMTTIIISQGVISVDKAAREYLASDEATAGLLASAIIVNSTFSCFLSNFFILVNKTKIPVRIFYGIPLAEKWLQQFLI